MPRTSGAPLSEPQRRWLGIVSEYVPIGGYGDSSEPPKWTGWYYDLFSDREIGAQKSPAFIADYFTLTNRAKVKYVGADGPKLGVFIVDTGGAPRAMVGPAATGFEAETSIAARLDDKMARTFPGKTALWRSSFAVAAAPEPPLGLVGRQVDCDGDGGAPEIRYALRAERGVGKVSITLLDHHGDPLGPEATVDVDMTYRVLAFTLPPPDDKRGWGVEAVDVRVHDLSAAVLPKGGYRNSSSPSVFPFDGRTRGIARRWRGAWGFSIGAPEASYNEGDEDDEPEAPPDEP